LNYSDGQSGDSSSCSESEERKAAEAAEKALVAAKKEEERKKKQDHWTNMVAHVAAVECISISLKSLLLRTHVQSCAHRQTPRHTHTRASRCCFLLTDVLSESSILAALHLGFEYRDGSK
jgi:hypothetical protein